MRRIAISGLVALAAVLGGVAVPAAAMGRTTAARTTAAQPTAAVRPTAAAGLTAAVRAASRTASRAVAAAIGDGITGVPLISCVLTTDCLGVEGSSSLTNGGRAIPTRVDRWNGSSWKGIGVALPKGTKSADLLGVSCQGAKSCLVVGDYYTSTSQNATSRVLALSYNGTSLKPTTTVPLPKGSTDAALTGVSCTTTRYCVAIGVAAGDTSAFGTAGSLNIIEMWNGAKWTLAHSAAASTATTQLSLSGVSCATAAFCVLAGATDSFNATSLVSTLYAASWNGKKLTTLKPATVSGGAGYLEPAGVSCATTSNCAVTGAVIGDITSSTPSVAAFTEIWNGKDWQLAKLAWPKGIKDSFTLGVSCYAAHDCEAVGVDGASTANNAPGGAAAAAFTGTAGALQGVPAPSKGDSTAFGGVGCLPSGRCVAIGETGKTTAKSPALMTGVWNGKAWKLGPGF